MSKKETEVSVNKDKVISIVSKEYIEDNNLKIFLDETIDLGEVVSEIESIGLKKDTNEMSTNE